MTDQQPEQSARATIDIMLAEAGWAVQSSKRKNCGERLQDIPSQSKEGLRLAQITAIRNLEITSLRLPDFLFFLQVDATPFHPLDRQATRHKLYGDHQIDRILPRQFVPSAFC